MSARKADINGFWEIKGNPLSRVGVFPYSGAAIGAPDKDRIYYVYRPAEELSDPETVASFRNKPLIDDHVMIGDEEQGALPAERKGVHGCIGESVYFDEKNQMLRGNLIIWSESLKREIQNGKDELSCGYRCSYDFTPGVWNGQKYDAIQRTIRGNHLALVDAGRMGPEVAVLDHMTFTVDAKDIQMEEMEKLLEAFAALGAKMDALLDRLPKEEKAEVEIEDEEIKAEVEDEDEKAEVEIEDEDEKAEVEIEDAEDEEEAKAEVRDEKHGKGFDALEKKLARLEKKLARFEGRPTLDAADVARQISQRDQLASRLSAFVGTFDASEMSLQQVAAYGVKKLGLKVAKGGEMAALEGYLHGRSVPHKAAMDSAKAAPAVASLIDELSA